MKKIQDHYFKQAKKDGYAARSAYKLEEIDNKHRLLRPGGRVLDLGCFPGSWLQYISKKIGDAGLVVGVDRTQLKMPLKPNMRFIHADINELDLSRLSQDADPFDLVCSDMAPNTTGVKAVDSARSYQLCQMALLVGDRYLKASGSILVKVLQGESFDLLLKQMRQDYQTVKTIKPKSSRSESKEVFVLGSGRKATKRGDP